MTTVFVAFAAVDPRPDQISLDRSLVAVGSAVAIALILLLVSQMLAARRKVRALEERFEGEKTRLAAEQLLIARREARVRLVEWKQREEEAIRQDAIKRSQSVIVGKARDSDRPFCTAASIRHG